MNSSRPLLLFAIMGLKRDGGNEITGSAVSGRTILKELLLGVFISVASAVAVADSVEDLYRSSCVVTGQDNLAERERGFRLALEQVIVKVTGDTRFAGDPRIVGLWPELAKAVAGFRYEDRKKGIQISDEQGTRDRAFDLTVNFDQARIDSGIAALGGKPWPAPRPSLLVLLQIQDSLGSYLLGTKSERGFGQRAALTATVRHLGVPLILPRMDAAERSEINVEGAVKGGYSIRSIHKKYPAEFLLAGRMVFTAKGFWDTEWRFFGETEVEEWRIGGVTFDRAIDDGIGRSIRILAGLGNE